MSAEYPETLEEFRVMARDAIDGGFGDAPIFTSRDVLLIIELAADRREP